MYKRFEEQDKPKQRYMQKDNRLDGGGFFLAFLRVFFKNERGRYAVKLFFDKNCVKN